MISTTPPYNPKGQERLCPYPPLTVFRRMHSKAYCLTLDLILRDPGLILRDPGLILRDPGLIWRDPRSHIA